LEGYCQFLEEPRVEIIFFARSTPTHDNLLTQHDICKPFGRSSDSFPVVFSENESDLYSVNNIFVCHSNFFGRRPHIFLVNRNLTFGVEVMVDTNSFATNYFRSFCRTDYRTSL
jgi:hypothetical protein